MAKKPTAARRKPAKVAVARSPPGRLAIPEPERRAPRSKAILLKVTEEENALLARVAEARGEPLATATRVLALAAAAQVAST